MPTQARKHECPDIDRRPPGGRNPGHSRALFTGCVAAFLMAMLHTSATIAGRNAGGALIVHTHDAYTYSAGTVCTTPYSTPASAEEADTTSGKDVGAVVWLLAAFPDSSNPGVAGIYFGIDYDSENVWFDQWKVCGLSGLELPDPGWPYEGRGNSIGYGTPIVGNRLFPFYAFSVNGGTDSSYFGTAINPTGGYAAFFDDSFPAEEDRVTKFATMGWSVSKRSCCLAGNACSHLTELECLDQGGRWLADVSTCAPNPCGRGYLIEPDGSGAYPTIQAGVDAVFDADTLILGDGTFTGWGNREIDLLGKAIVIRSRLDDPALCKIDCQGLGRGFIFSAGEDSLSVLSGVTITNGRAETGGAIFCSGTSPEIVNCVFDYNSAADCGGAVHCTNASSPKFQSCIFHLNDATGSGGGLCSDLGSQPLLDHCTFDHNVTEGVGACMSTIGSMPVTVENCILAFGIGGEAVACSGEPDAPVLGCSDVFGNEGGDYAGCISDQMGIRNNFSADPLFCAEGNPAGPYAVADNSPCAPENNPECGLVGVRGAGCTILSVNPEGSGEYPSIQAAADAASGGDIVLLEPGIYIERGSSGINLGGKPIIIRSQGRGRLSATIDCQGSKRGFIFDSGEGPGSMIDGLRIINGSELYGGAVLCSTGTSPSLHQCVFESSRADSLGGGICCWTGASPIIEDCTFEGDTASFGGGIALLGTAAPRIDRCSFIRNNATRGGGAYIGNASPIELNYSTFYLNTAEIGGAIYCDSEASPLVSRGTFVRNGAPTGGGVYSASSQVSFDRTIVVYGTQGGAFGGSEVTLSCSDVYGNTGGDWSAPIAAQSGWRGNFSLDPRFCDLELGDLRIWNHSPCSIVACGPLGAWPIGCFAPLGLDPNSPEETQSTASFSVSSSPNPFTGGTTIRFVVPTFSGSCRVRVQVFSVTGQLVRTLLDAAQHTGSHSLDWDGRDGSGDSVPSGVYFCQVRIGDWEGRCSALRVK